MGLMVPSNQAWCASGDSHIWAHAVWPAKMSSLPCVVCQSFAVLCGQNEANGTGARRVQGRSSSPKTFVSGWDPQSVALHSNVRWSPFGVCRWAQSVVAQFGHPAESSRNG